MLKLAALLMTLLPMVLLGVMVDSNLRGDVFKTLLAGVCCYLSVKSTLLLMRLIDPRPSSQLELNEEEWRKRPLVVSSIPPPVRPPSPLSTQTSLTVHDSDHSS